ncbi:hypothetical protein [Leptospira haakeii]|nr:hypothetical protein [Leptospira haakeii]
MFPSLRLHAQTRAVTKRRQALVVRRNCAQNFLKLMKHSILLFLIVSFEFCAPSIEELNIKGSVYFRMVDIFLPPADHFEIFKERNLQEKLNKDLYGEIDTGSVLKSSEVFESVLVLEDNSEKIVRIIIPKYLKKEIWKIKPFELKRKGEKLVFDFNVLNYKDVYILNSINKLEYQKGEVPISK